MRESGTGAGWMGGVRENQAIDRVRTCGVGCGTSLRENLAYGFENSATETCTQLLSDLPSHTHLDGQRTVRKIAGCRF